MLRTHFPAIEITSDINNELIFSLPEQSIDKYPRMLDELQKNLESLHISKFSIHMSTLEELFLKAHREIHKRHTADMNHSEQETVLHQENNEQRRKSAKKSMKTKDYLADTKSIALLRADLEHFEAAGKQLNT